MSEQKPLQKPIAHHLGPKIPNRPISSGYELKSEISPELQRNIPSVIPEATKNEKNEKEEKSRKDKLNINAPSFHPKSKPNYANTNANEPKKMTEAYRKPLPIYPNSKNYNNNNYQYYQSMNNNMNYGNHGYYPPQNFVYNNIPPQQIGYQQGYYQNNMYINQNAMPAPSYNNYNINKSYNTTNNFYQKPNYNPGGTMSAQKSSLTTSTLANTKQTTSLKMAEGYIPKSMRNKEEPPTNLNLNLKASKYIPTNVKLKEKEEQIQKLQEKEEEKNKNTNEKKDEKLDEKEKEDIKEPPTTNKDQNKKPEEENKVEPKKEKKSNLQMLLESNPTEGKKTKDKSKKSDADSQLLNYPKNTKKTKSITDKKIDLVNEKQKKLKEEEDKRKKEEERKKREEEKKRREEEKKRKEEEKKIPEKEKEIPIKEDIKVRK